MHFTSSQAKRIRPAATPRVSAETALRVSAETALRVSACVVLTGDGSMWLDLPGSFG